MDNTESVRTLKADRDFPQEDQQCRNATAGSSIAKSMTSKRWLHVMCLGSGVGK
jgi:hypothetical protein